MVEAWGKNSEWYKHSPYYLLDVCIKSIQRICETLYVVDQVINGLIRNFQDNNK